MCSLLVLPCAVFLLLCVWQFASGLVTVTLLSEILPFMLMPSFRAQASVDDERRQPMLHDVAKAVGMDEGGFDATNSGNGSLNNVSGSGGGDRKLGEQDL